MRDESALPTVLRKKLPPNLEKIKLGEYTPEDFDYPIHLYLKENDIRVKEDGSDIVSFLRGKNVLVTGGTGFLGKLLIEKLLRSCKDIGTIYMMVRPKKGKDPQSRVNECLDNWVFHKLSEIRPNYKEKVIGICSDFEADGLGLSEESRTIIKENVNIVYHVAATIRFNEPLKTAVKINVQGTQEMLTLTKECKKLEVFVHVSSAFANCHVKHIAEEFYPPHLDPDKLITMTEKLPDRILNQLTPSLLGEIPNTYVYTKQIGEDVVKKEAVGIPACIYRPSIVIASCKEPIKSWVDNIYGPVGLIQGVALGLMHVMLGNPDGRCDMVPVDYVINSCIAASYKTAKKRDITNVPVFNFTTSKENPLYWRNLGLTEAQGVKVGSSTVLYRAFFRFTSSIYLFNFLFFLLHIVPAHVVDFFAVLFGSKPRLKIAYEKISKFISALSYFTLNEWTFDNKNIESLWDELNEIDKENFRFEMKLLNWRNYFDTLIVASRELLIADFLDTLEQGRRHFRRLTIVHYTGVSILLFSSVYFLLNTVFFFVPLAFIALVIFYTWIDVN